MFACLLSFLSCLCVPLQSGAALLWWCGPVEHAGSVSVPAGCGTCLASGPAPCVPLPVLPAQERTVKGHFSLPLVYLLDSVGEECTDTHRVWKSHYSGVFQNKPTLSILFKWFQGFEQSSPLLNNMFLSNISLWETKPTLNIVWSNRASPTREKNSWMNLLGAILAFQMKLN